MKKYVRYMLGGFFLLAALACYVKAVENRLLLTTGGSSVVIEKEASPLTLSQAVFMCELEEEQQEPFHFTLWQQREETAVQNEDLGRTESVAALAVYGNTELLFPVGAWLDREDTNGCLIDEKTAWELFGSVQIEDTDVTVDGVKKQVRGVLRGVEDLVVYEAASAGSISGAGSADGVQQTFSYITVAAGKTKTAQQVENDFMARHALTGHVLDPEILKSIASVCILLLPAAVGFWLAGAAARMFLKGGGSKEKKSALVLTAAVVLAAILYLAVINLHIPADMLPTKWSDFSFWKGWWESTRETFLRLMLSDKCQPQRAMLGAFYRTAGYSLLSLACARIAVGSLKFS